MRRLHISVPAASVLLWSTFAAAPAALANPQADAPDAVGHAVERQDEEAKKRLVIEFYNKALNDKDFEAASRYLGDKYIQHNPTATDGPEGLKAFVEFLKTRFPQSRNEIKRAWVDGDYVILHVHSVRVPGTLGRAIVDIFRLENGKVVEHWDVIQDVPAPAEAKNANGMF